MARILAVDNEQLMLNVVARLLTHAGHEVLTAVDGTTALKRAREEPVELVILDLNLPDMDGFFVCRTLRSESPVPILILTGRGREADIVLGLDLGADDYMSKPCRHQELLARVRALLRRADMARPGMEAGPTLLREAGLEVDLVAHRAHLAGNLVHLTMKEFGLLSFLMQHRGRVFSKEQLLTEIWGYKSQGDSRTVIVHVNWLRQKIEVDDSTPRLIETVRGIGYRFRG